MAKEKFKTVHYLIQILKEYGIKNIVASPGTQNSTFNYLVQKDKDFKCYSVVDERSASYVALGISNATTEPAAITCTGATAARNYMSAMTEAYYRNIPVVALTFYNPTSSRFNMAPQYTDRSLSQNDIKEISVTLPEIKDSNDKTKVITALNAVLSTAKNKSLPVHINCPASFNYEIEGLPSNLWSTKYYSEDFSSLKNELKNKKFAVFLGEHHKFDEEEQNAISRFAKSYNIPVFCDHSSNYCGENKVLLTKFRHFATGELRPELILEGGVLADYI